MKKVKTKFSKNLNINRDEIATKGDLLILEGRILQKVEKIFEEKFEQKFEQKFEEKFEQKFEQKFEEKFEQKFEQKFEEKFEQKFEQKFNPIRQDINEMKDDIAKVLVFLYEHFPIQQHQVRENTDRIEDHEVRIVRVEDVIDISAIK